MDYVAVIDKEDGTDYGVSFPDFPRCVTAGGTLEEAYHMAKEALEFHIEGLLEDGEEIPRPTAFNDISSENKGAYTFLIIGVDVNDSIARVNITMKQTELNRIERYISDKGFTRSGFFQQAAKEYIQSHSS